MNYHVEIWVGESQEYRESFEDLDLAIAFANQHIGDNWTARFLKKAPCGHFVYWFDAYEKFTKADITQIFKDEFLLIEGTVESTSGKFAVRFDFPFPFTEVPAFMEEIAKTMNEHGLYKVTIERSKVWSSALQRHINQWQYQCFTNMNPSAAPPKPTIKEAMAAAVEKFTSENKAK